MTKDEALRLALEALKHGGCPPDCKDGMTDSGGVHPWGEAALIPCPNCKTITACQQALEQSEPEPVAWISVKDALPKAVRGVSYKQSLTDVVLVRHLDRPDYPITAHAVVGEGLGAGIAIPTEGASEHPEIAWYSQCQDLNNPFGLKNDDYGRYLPKIFGTKITHWKPIDTSPPKRKPLTDDELKPICDEYRILFGYWVNDFARAIEAKLKEKNT